MQLHTFLKYLTSLYKERVWSRKSIATISNLAYFVFWRSFVEERIYRVIHKTLLDFSPLRYSSREGHAEEEHVNRGRDTPIFCPTLQVLDIGDAADVNPVITFLPHMYNVCVAGTWLQDWHLSLHQGWTYRVPVSWTETWSVSPKVYMLPFGVTTPATVPQRSEIPEGLMINTVHLWSYLVQFF